MIKSAFNSNNSVKNSSLFLSILFFITGLIIFVAVMILKLHVQGEIIELGYKLNNVENKKKGLIQEKKKLDIEIQYLKSPDRIDELAEGFGMKIPNSERIIHLKRRSVMANR